MSLMDEPPPYQEFSQLSQPLVSLPLNNLNEITDIYTVGLSPIQRWRSFIDAENWDPYQFHDSLLRKRAYHARCVWESVWILSFTDSSWVTIPSYEMLRDIASFELRVVEFEILGYQLTCGMLGIGANSFDKLFDCAIGLYVTLIWLTEKILGPNRTKTQRLAHVEIVQMKPGRSDSKKNICKHIDRFIFMLQEYLKKGEVMMGLQQTTHFLSHMTMRLRKNIIALDEIIIVI